MNRFWISAAVMLALVIGCDSKPANDASSTDSDSAKVKTIGDEQSIDGPADLSDGNVQLTSATESSDAVEDAGTADVLDDATAEDQVDATAATASEGQAPSTDQIKAEINERLRAAMQARDAEQVVAVLEAGRAQLPDDAEIAMALLRFQLQQDLQLANGDDKQAVAARFLKTAALAEEIFGDAEVNDPRFAQLRNLALFNQSRALALDGQTDAAVTALGAAYNQGFEQYKGLEKDPFFVSIADAPAFQQVIAENTERLRENYRQSARKEFAESEPIEFDFELPDLEAKPVKLADFAGKVLIVDIWGTWCGPCRMEIPHFIELRDKYKDDLEIVGITYEGLDNEQDTIKQISDFVAAEGVNYPCVIGDEATEKALEIRGFPTTLFIDRDGKVRLKVVGYHPYEKLDGYVAELIGEEKPSS